MRIDYKTHPVLKILSTGKFGTLPYYLDDLRAMNFIQKVMCPLFQEYNPQFQNVFHVSQTFAEATAKVEKKLIIFWKEALMKDSRDIDISSTFLCKNNVIMFDHHIKKGSPDVEMTYFMFDKSGTPLAFHHESVINERKPISWISRSWQIAPSDKEGTQEFINKLIGGAICLDLYKKFAEIETKILEPGQKKFTSPFASGKFINGIKQKITYLDSKWFTNLVKSDAFKVSGHFRLQPYKNDKGEWDHKIIWINEFMKEGYTAPARKIKEKEVCQSLDQASG